MVPEQSVTGLEPLQMPDARMTYPPVSPAVVMPLIRLWMRRAVEAPEQLIVPLFRRLPETLLLGLMRISDTEQPLLAVVMKMVDVALVDVVVSCCFCSTRLCSRKDCCVICRVRAWFCTVRV